MSSDEDLTIARHLVRRLRELGVSEGFGIVGDYVLKFVGAIEAEGCPVLVTSALRADQDAAAHGGFHS